MITLQFDKAIAKATTPWLRQWLRENLPLLMDGTIDRNGFAANLDKIITAKDLGEKTSINYRSNVARAIALLEPNHPAIALVSPTAEEYTRANLAQAKVLADRPTVFIPAGNDEKIVAAAANAIGCNDWASIFAGLAILCGRRAGELLTSKFAAHSDRSLKFSEMLKKQQPATIEIPTLIEADRVLVAIDRVRRLAQTEGIAPGDIQIADRNKYYRPIREACDRLYGKFIPPRPGDRTQIYTHLTRSVYTTIAHHWYCDPAIPEHKYKAMIQGHFDFDENGELIPNFRSNANYSDYVLSDGGGNKDGRAGIKLSLYPGLVPIREFLRQAPAPMTTDKPNPDSNYDRLDRRIDQLTEQMQQFMTTIAGITLPSEKEEENTVSAVPDRKNLPESLLSVEEFDRLKVENINLQASLKQRNDYIEQLEKRIKDLSSQNLQLKSQIDLAEQRWANAAAFFGGTPMSPNGDADIFVAKSINKAETVEATANSHKLCDRIIDSVMKWNDSQTSRDNKILISQKILGVFAPFIGEYKFVLFQSRRQERMPEIVKHHQKHELGDKKHNHQLTNIDEILRSIGRDYLNIPNWADIVWEPENIPTTTIKRGNPKGSQSRKRCDRIINAVLAWNDRQADNSTRLIISAPVVRTFAPHLGGYNYTTFAQQLDERKVDIWEHNQKHNLSNKRHNYRLANINAIVKEIAKEMLSISDWQKVEWFDYKNLQKSS